MPSLRALGAGVTGVQQWRVPGTRAQACGAGGLPTEVLPLASQPDECRCDYLATGCVAGDFKHGPQAPSSLVEVSEPRLHARQIPPSLTMRWGNDCYALV